jgi:glycosyltransferase involved in cell wall biosynthesis
MSWRARIREKFRDLANWLLHVDPIMRASFWRAERIMVATQESKALVPGAHQNKCTVQFGVGLSREYLAWTNRCQRVSDGSLRLLYAGRLLEWKGIDLAIRAIAAVRRQGVAVRFTVVGTGPAETRLRRLASESGIEDAIRWLKWMPRDELQQMYRQHDVLLFPSLRDSGGMVVLEAMAHGLPVVCTDRGGPGVMVNARCGRVVRTASRTRDEVIAALSDALYQLDRDRVLLKKLSAGARARAWEFDFGKVVGQVYPPPLSNAVTELVEQAVS